MWKLLHIYFHKVTKFLFITFAEFKTKISILNKQIYFNVSPKM